MTEKHILFGEFEFPVEKGFEYLVNENLPETDFLCINEPHDAFSMMFEKGFPIFTVPKNSDRDYLLFELKRSDIGITEDAGLGAGAIVGIVVGSVVVLGLGGFAFVWFVIKKKTWAEFLAIFKKK